MKHAHHLAAYLVAIATAAVATAAPAVAAPKQSGGTLPLDCPAPVGTVEIVSPDNDASFTPGFIVGTHQLLIPYRIDATFTATDPVTGETETISFSDVKPAPVPDAALTCTLNTTQVDPETGMTFTATGTVVVVVRGEP